MIDLWRTRNGIDIESQRHAALIAAIIAQAVEDAAMPFSDEEKKLAQNRRPEAVEAIQWLFVKGSLFEAYCRLIGIEAESLRQALLDPSRDTYTDLPKTPFTNLQRRIVRRRHELLLRARAAMS